LRTRAKPDDLAARMLAEWAARLPPQPGTPPPAVAAARQQRRLPRDALVHIRTHVRTQRHAGVRQPRVMAAVPQRRQDRSDPRKQQMADGARACPCVGSGCGLGCRCRTRTDDRGEGHAAGRLAFGYHPPVQPLADPSSGGQPRWAGTRRQVVWQECPELCPAWAGRQSPPSAGRVAGNLQRSSGAPDRARVLRPITGGRDATAGGARRGGTHGVTHGLGGRDHGPRRQFAAV